MLIKPSAVLKLKKVLLFEGLFSCVLFELFFERLFYKYL